MNELHFPEPFIHKHQPLRNVNEIIDEKLTFGQHLADSVARMVGSWKFIIIQSSIIVLWVILNIVAFSRHWDPYPFILMNLFLSLQAAYTAPIIMVSQNRLTAGIVLMLTKIFSLIKRQKKKYVRFSLTFRHKIKLLCLFKKHLIISRN